MKRREFSIRGDYGTRLRDTQTWMDASCSGIRHENDEDDRSPAVHPRTIEPYPESMRATFITGPTFMDHNSNSADQSRSASVDGCTLCSCEAILAPLHAIGFHALGAAFHYLLVHS